MILKSKFWWLLSLIQSYWAVESSTRAAQKFCSRCLACPHPLVIVANCAKLRYDTSPYLWFSLWGPLPSIERLRRKLPVPRNNRPLLSLSQVFRCQFNLWHHCYFYTAILGNIIMLLLSKQPPHAAARDKMASTSHYNITIQKSPFIRLKRCCPDLPHTVLYGHIDTMHSISKGYLRHIVPTVGKAGSVGQNIIATSSRQTLS